MLVISLKVVADSMFPADRSVSAWYKVSKMGPKTLPWGTPKVKVTALEVTPSSVP